MSLNPASRLRPRKNRLANLATEEDELLVRLNVTGLCMSDIHNMTNDWDVPPMSAFGVRCTGHEGAGVVVKIGSRCGPQWKVSLGGDCTSLAPIHFVIWVANVLTLSRSETVWVSSLC